MRVPAVWVPNDPVPLLRMVPAEVLGNPQLVDAWTEALAGAYVPRLMGRLLGGADGDALEGVRDDNRSALLVGHRHAIRGREYVAAVKGCGAEFDAYANARLTATKLSEICRDPSLLPRLAAEDGAASGFMTGERWFGNTPYGGQAPDNAAIGLLASLRADMDEIAGFFVCPIVALVRLPDEVARLAAKFSWYRRYEGGYWQEVRLMPSNVRVHFHSPVAFGVDTAEAFRLFGIDSFESAEAFLGNLARSAAAALTLYARTLRHDARADAYRGLGYDDVWLDKDAVIARDGTLHFADLEGIEDLRAPDTDRVRDIIRAQFFRNVYEANYALEAVAAEAGRRWGVPGNAGERRAWIVEVLARACRGDPFVRVEREGGRAVFVVEPATDPDICGVTLDFASGGD